MFNGGKNMENNMRIDDNFESSTMQLDVALKANDVVPLNYKAAIESYTEAEKNDIVALSEKIDVRKVENIMSYGSVTLRTTFEQCGRFLNNESGSVADQEIINRVIKLSKEAFRNYADFNVVVKEGNIFQKALLRLSNRGKLHKDKMKHRAVTNYKLLNELKESCELWLGMLKGAMSEIERSMVNDENAIDTLEKYIIAGRLAEKRIEKEIEEAKNKYNETGLQKYDQDYNQMTSGYDIFVVKMDNLEKSRIMYYLSVAQLNLVRHSNRNVQVCIRTQLDNSMALLAQQMRNAILNAKTDEAIEGKKALSRLNDAMVRDVTKSIDLTAKEAEEMLYAGFYDVETAKQAVETVISSCNEIKNIAEEMLPKMKADVTELSKLIEELEPCMKTIKQ